MEAGEEFTDGLAQTVRAWLLVRDPDGAVSTDSRPNGLIDITVVSRLFEALDSRDRQALIWPAFDPIPKSDMIRLTQCLLLTPEEAGRGDFLDRAIRG